MTGFQQIKCLDAVAAVLFEDGKRPVEYYLEEARVYVTNGQPFFAHSALCSALSVVSKTDRRWVHIMRAIRFTRRAYHGS